MNVVLLSDAPVHCTTIWCNYASVQFDPYHLLAEFGFSIFFELLQLILVVILWRKVIKPRWFKQIHQEIDQEHGVIHEERNVL